MPLADSEVKHNPIDTFRDALEAVVEIAQALHPDCDTVADLVGVVELAMANDGQLRILMGRVKAAQTQKAKR